MVFNNPCPDLLTGNDCSTSWFDALSPATTIFVYTLIGINAVLALGALIKFVRVYKQGTSPSRSKFQHQLLLLIFLGSFTQEVAHIVYYSFGMFMKFDIDTTEGLISGYAYTFSLAVAFSTAYCTTTLIHLLITNPLRERQKRRESIKNKVVGVDISIIKLDENISFKSILKFLLPNAVAWITVWVLLPLGVIPSMVFLFRIFLGIIGVPLLFQGIQLCRSGWKLVHSLDQMLDAKNQKLGFGISAAEMMSGNVVRETPEKYITLRKKVKTYTLVMGGILIQNALMAYAISFTRIMHDELVFFIVAALFNVSLAGVGTLVLYLIDDHWWMNPDDDNGEKKGVESVATTVDSAAV